MVTKPNRTQKPAARRVARPAKPRAPRPTRPRKGESAHAYLIRVGRSLPPDVQAQLPTTDEFMKWRHGGRGL